MTFIYIDGRVARIEGVEILKGGEVFATDLRAGVIMILAGLCAEGVTKISNIKYIDRGYEKIEYKLRSLGVDIKRVEE